jgi:hypothetical protein
VSTSGRLLTQASQTGATAKPDLTEQFFDRIRAQASKSLQLTSLLEALFPVVKRKGFSIPQQYFKKWFEEARICHPDCFDRYFFLTLPSDVLSHSDLDALLNATNSVEEFVRLVSDFHKRGIDLSALELFEPYVEKMPIDNGTHFIQGLMDISDVYGKKTEGFTLLRPVDYFARLAVVFLRRLNFDERADVLLKCNKRNGGLSLFVHLLASDEQRREGVSADILFQDQDFHELKSAFVAKLEKEAEEQPEHFIERENLISLLYRWKLWGATGSAVNWVNAQIVHPVSVFQIFKCMYSKRNS